MLEKLQDKAEARGMASGLREFFKTRGGQIFAIALCCIALLVSLYVVKGFFGASEAEALSSERVFVDASYNPPKSFHASLKPGMKVPITAPSGKETGYPAELCYWTKDGGNKRDPTAVLMNEWIGKAGPTFCPDCGRLVVGHNPLPKPGQKPPPTEAEYKSRSHSSGSATNRDTR